MGGGPGARHQRLSPSSFILWPFFFCCCVGGLWREGVGRGGRHVPVGRMDTETPAAAQLLQPETALAPLSPSFLATTGGEEEEEEGGHQLVPPEVEPPAHSRLHCCFTFCC